MYRKLENISSASLFSSSWQHKAVSLEGRHLVPYGRPAGMLVLSEGVFWVLRVFKLCFFFVFLLFSCFYLVSCYSVQHCLP